MHKAGGRCSQGYGECNQVVEFARDDQEQADTRVPDHARSTCEARATKHPFDRATEATDWWGCFHKDGGEHEDRGSAALEAEVGDLDALDDDEEDDVDGHEEDDIDALVDDEVDELDDEWDDDDLDDMDVEAEAGEEPVEQRHVGAKIGRNDPCPCGSGKKYKKCCLQ